MKPVIRGLKTSTSRERQARGWTDGVCEGSSIEASRAWVVSMSSMLFSSSLALCISSACYSHPIDKLVTSECNFLSSGTHCSKLTEPKNWVTEADWFVASWSEIQVTTWTCNYAWSRTGFLWGWALSCESDSVWVDSIITELNFGHAARRPRIAVGVRKPRCAHTHRHTHSLFELDPGTPFAEMTDFGPNQLGGQ